MEKRKNPIYMNEFIDNLQIQLIKSLRRRGSCIKRGKLIISTKVENYLIKKFNITKRMQLSNILNILRLDQNIVKNSFDINPSKISCFKIKFGNKSVVGYRTRQLNSNTLEKVFNSSRIFHWEFIRTVDMTGMNDENSLNERYERRISVWRTLKNLK
jgi:hypothetical protein